MDEKQDGYTEALSKVLLGQNPSGLNPVEYNLVVLPVFIEEKTDSGIILATNEVNRDREAAEVAHVVKISDMAFTLDGDAWPCAKPVVGSKVLMRRYAGSKYQKDGVTYRVITDRDICAIVGE
jgi:co-chaperonin GroES (HSP10)